MTKTLRTALLAALFALPLLSVAQLLPSAPYLDFRHRTAFLLNDPTIQKHVKVSSKVAATIQGVWLDYAKRQTAIGNVKLTDKRLEKLDQEISDRLLATLSPAQQGVLLRTAVLVTGPSLLGEAAVQTALGLSVNQITTIEQILAKASAPTFKLEKIVSKQVREAATAEDRAQIQQDYAAERRRLAELRKLDEAKALNVLSAAQRKKFESGAF